MSDLKELVTTERFREIHDARQQVIEDERAINQAVSQGQISTSAAVRHYQRSVKGFVRELETMLNPINGDANEHWTSTHIGTIELPNGDTRQINGLGEFLDVPESISVEMSVQSSDHYYQITTEKSETVHTQPQWDLIENAFRVANHALADNNMDLDPEQDASSVWEFREIEDVDDINPDEWSDITFQKSKNGDSE